MKPRILKCKLIYVKAENYVLRVLIVLKLLKILECLVRVEDPTFKESLEKALPVKNKTFFLENAPILRTSEIFNMVNT